jgi:hypothetical protein
MSAGCICNPPTVNDADKRGLVLAAAGLPAEPGHEHAKAEWQEECERDQQQQNLDCHGATSSTINLSTTSTHHVYGWM